NPELAHEWLTLSARGNDPLGQRLLGDFYLNGENGAPDPLIAAGGYSRPRKAALLDDADAQAMLGAAYQIGAGVPRDAVTALAWLTRAHRSRSRFAERFYVAVRDSCTDEQREEAERRAD